MKQAFIQKTVPVGKLQCNCQILVCPETHEAVLVDPGDEAPLILQQIAAIETTLQAKLKIKALLHTHAHFDHIGATRAVKEHFIQAAQQNGETTEIPQIFLHRADEMIYNMLPQQAQRFGFKLPEALPIDRYFEDEQTLSFGKLKFTFLHTPGHSPGGMCFRLHEDSALKIPETVFTGDTLFREDIGRDDLWGGDGHQLVNSIRNRILTLNDDTCAWPGHGPSTTVGYERKHNPYV